VVRQTCAIDQALHGCCSIEPVAAVPFREVHLAIERCARRTRCHWFGNVVDDVAARLEEPKSAVASAHDLESLFVHGAMVRVAEENQVVELRFAAVRPVDDVMGVEERAIRTTREPAAAIANLQRALLCCRDRAALSTDIEDRSVSGDLRRDDAGVAREP